MTADRRAWRRRLGTAAAAGAFGLGALGPLPFDPRAAHLFPAAKAAGVRAFNAPPCCDPCCNPPSIRCTVITSPCPCLFVGRQFCLYQYDPGGGCIGWATDSGAYDCDGSALMIGLTCCPLGCMGSDWTLGGTTRVWFNGSAATLRDDHTCDPFFQHWDGVTYENNPACGSPGAGTPFSVEFDAVGC